MRILATAIMAVVIGSTGGSAIAEDQGQSDLGCAIVIGKLLSMGPNKPEPIVTMFNWYVERVSDNYDISRDEVLDTLIDFEDEVSALPNDVLLRKGVSCAEDYVTHGEPNV